MNGPSAWKSGIPSTRQSEPSPYILQSACETLGHCETFEPAMNAADYLAKAQARKRRQETLSRVQWQIDSHDIIACDARMLSNSLGPLK